MKEFTIQTVGKYGRVEKKSIPYSKTFEHFGYKWVIHRPLSKNKWTVSEYSTGFSAGTILYDTRAIAEASTIAKLNHLSLKVVTAAVDQAIEKYGEVNY